MSHPAVSQCRQARLILEPAKAIIAGPVLREAASGHRVACHFFETLPPPVIVARSGPPQGKFAERLAAFEAAKQKQAAQG